MARNHTPNHILTDQVKALLNQLNTSDLRSLQETVNNGADPRSFNWYSTVSAVFTTNRNRFPAIDSEVFGIIDALLQERLG